MYNRNSSGSIIGLFCLFWLTLGLFMVPIMCIVTLVRDGPENTPFWQTVVALLTIVVGGMYLVTNVLKLPAFPLH